MTVPPRDPVQPPTDPTQPVPPAPVRPGPTLAAKLATFLAAHPFYGYQDLLLEVCDGDEDVFIRAYCDGTFAPPVRAVVLDSAGAARLTVWLLRLQVRIILGAG